MSSIRLPSLTDRGHHAHQIRRSIERAYTDTEHCRLRAREAGFTDLAVGLTEVLSRLECLRLAAEQHRRDYTPLEFRLGGANPMESPQP